MMWVRFASGIGFAAFCRPNAGNWVLTALFVWLLTAIMGCQSAPHSMARGGPAGSIEGNAPSEARAHWVRLYSEAPIPDERFEVRVGNWQRWPSGKRTSWPQFHWLDPHTVIASLWRIDDWEARRNGLHRASQSLSGNLACSGRAWWGFCVSRQPLGFQGANDRLVQSATEIARSLPPLCS